MYAKKKREWKRGQGRTGNWKGKGEERWDKSWDEEREVVEKGELLKIHAHGILLCGGSLFWNVVMRNLTWENVDEYEKMRKKHKQFFLSFSFFFFSFFLSGGFYSLNNKRLKCTWPLRSKRNTVSLCPALYLLLSNRFPTRCLSCTRTHTSATLIKPLPLASLLCRCVRRMFHQ